MMLRATPDAPGAQPTDRRRDGTAMTVPASVQPALSRANASCPRTGLTGAVPLPTLIPKHPARAVRTSSHCECPTHSRPRCGKTSELVGR